MIVVINHDFVRTAFPEMLPELVRNAGIVNSMHSESGAFGFRLNATQVHVGS